MKKITLSHRYRRFISNFFDCDLMRLQGIVAVVMATVLYLRV